MSDAHSGRRDFVGGLLGGLAALPACRRPAKTAAGVPIRGLDGSMMRVTELDLGRLERDLSGRLWRPGSAPYEDARSLWNARIQRRPAVVVRAVKTMDVVATVRFAQAHGLVLTIRAGGHNHRGYAVRDASVLLDLRGMRDATVDRERHRAIVGPGLTFGDLDALTHSAGLGCTGAIVSQVGLPGYLLGGGLGWLHRTLGAGCDHIVSAELVTADGHVVDVDESQHPELMWALRGGGGNFGVVTRFGLRLHPIDQVYAGLLFFDLDAMAEIAPFVDAYLDDAPDELNVWMFHRRAPEAASIPTELRGRHVLILGVTCLADANRAKRLVAPLRRFRPLLDGVRTRPYPEWQRALDGAWGNGFCNEWVGHYLHAYDSAAIDTVQRFVRQVPSPFTDVKLARLGGVFARARAEESAFGFRAARYAMVIQSRWQHPSQAATVLDWTRRFHAAMARHATGNVYSNFVGDSPRQSVVLAYETAVMERLRRLKRDHDPFNLFRSNLNIQPA